MAKSPQRVPLTNFQFLVDGKPIECESIKTLIPQPPPAKIEKLERITDAAVIWITVAALISLCVMWIVYGVMK